MTSTRPGLGRRTRADRDAALQAERARILREAPGEVPWGAGSVLLAGVLAFGGAGWLVGHWTGWVWPTPVGVLVGTALAVVDLWFRYGVDRSAASTAPVTSTDAGPAAAVRGGASRSTHDRLEDAP
jgi:hypothetical protein